MRNDTATETDTDTATVGTEAVTVVRSLDRAEFAKLTKGETIPGPRNARVPTWARRSAAYDPTKDRLTQAPTDVDFVDSETTLLLEMFDGEDNARKAHQCDWRIHRDTILATARIDALRRKIKVTERELALTTRHLASEASVLRSGDPTALEAHKARTKAANALTGIIESMGTAVKTGLMTQEAADSIIFHARLKAEAEAEAQAAA